MKEFTDVALNVLTRHGAEYGDMRIIEERQNHVYAERRAVKHMGESESLGFSVRALKDGAWGFASGTTLHRDEVARVAELAVETARASASVPKADPARMADEPAAVETRCGPCEEDPFAIPNREKADLVLEACTRMMDVPGIVRAHGSLQFVRVRRFIANTDGSLLDLTNTFTNPSFGATAAVDGDSQSRSYQGGARQAGFEFLEEVDPLGNAARWAEEAVIKCRAEECPQGVMDLVLDPMHLALTMHESVGHPTELDRILGWEANMAGRSFVRVEDVGSLRYGSDLVNFTVDNTLDGGLGSWFFDDDGVRMRKFSLIRNGILQNLSCTRETAAVVGWPRSTGCCRASGYDRFPINRIPNLYMEPGADDSVSPEDLISGVDKGIYIQGMGSFSIDQMRNNFQFGGDFFRMIENGRLTKYLKKVTYQAQTRDFWGSCDGVTGKAWWRPHGIMNCGKGEPMQIMRMTHGAGTVRFRNIRVGGAKL